MEEVYSSETSVSTYKSIWRYEPADQHRRKKYINFTENKYILFPAVFHIIYPVTYDKKLIVIVGKILHNIIMYDTSEKR
jgi:hypothetical protein